MKNVICILFLCFLSVFGRVAINDIKDDISNIITDVLSVKTEKSIVNSTNIQTNYSDNRINDNLNDVTINNTAVKPLTTDKEVSDNLLDVDHNESISNEPKADNGTALILTPFIKEGRLKEARNASRVDSKPFLGIESYSGFFTVNETYNSNIFFWYFPILNKPVNESPWMIWLQGGPGASSMTGLFDEIGPFTVVNDTLIQNPYTWLHNHSVLFIDNPVGTGYSFTKHIDGFATDMETYSRHLYLTLKQFIQVFPELKSVPLYIAGESYAGKYVPALAMEIHKRKEKIGTDINLKGIILGNAYVDPDMISHIAWPYYYFGILEREQIDTVKPLVDSFQKHIRDNKSVEAKSGWMKLVTALLLLANQRHGYNFLRDELPVGKYIKFLQTSEVKRAIHVGDIHFMFVNATVNLKLAPEFLSTAKPIVERLLENYRVLAYCGQLDLMLPCVFTSENYRTWHWNGTEEFITARRYPYMFDNTLAGYHKTGGHLTEVVVRGAGHMVPLDKPSSTQHLITLWTHEKPLIRLPDPVKNAVLKNETTLYYL